jgi:hypothetical protein
MHVLLTLLNNFTYIQKDDFIQSKFTLYIVKVNK